jgi:hypothetical protein
MEYAQTSTASAIAGASEHRRDKAGICASVMVQSLAVGVVTRSLRMRKRPLKRTGKGSPDRGIAKDPGR